MHFTTAQALRRAELAEEEKQNQIDEGLNEAKKQVDDSYIDRRFSSLDHAVQVRLKQLGDLSKNAFSDISYIKKEVKRWDLDAQQRKKVDAMISQREQKINSAFKA